jgi:hypothetical protein
MAGQELARDDPVGIWERDILTQRRGGAT